MSDEGVEHDIIKLLARAAAGKILQGTFTFTMTEEMIESRISIATIFIADAIYRGVEVVETGRKGDALAPSGKSWRELADEREGSLEKAEVQSARVKRQLAAALKVLKWYATATELAEIAKLGEKP